MDQFLKGLTSAVGNAAQGVGNFFSQDFSPAVQRFGQAAQQDLAKIPTQLQPFNEQPTVNVLGPVVKNFVQGAEGAAQGVAQGAQGIAQQGLNYFNPENQGTADQPVANFWNTPAAQALGGQIRLPQFNFAEQIGQQANQQAGGGAPGAVAGFAASALPGMAEGIMNVPSQVAQFGIDAGNAIDNGSITNPQKAVGLAAELANPLLTVATLGKAPELLEGVKAGSWGMSALKGLLNGMGYGGVFGGLQGLQQGQNAKDLQTQFEQALPDVAQGMLTGGVLGSVLGPAGKFFFGNKEPGQTAALAENGLVPPSTMQDAYHILGVSPDASLQDIRGAYTNALQEFHPQSGGTPESLDALNNAYEMTTRNTAPQVQFDKNGQPQVNFSDEFGTKTLSSDQVAQARQAAAQDTAFQARLANLKAGKLPLKTDIPGQLSADDFLQHGADLLSPEGQQGIAAKLQQAAANQPAFHDLLDSVGQDVQGRTLSNIKSPTSLVQKIITKRMNGEPDYSLGNVQDALRGTVVVNSQADLDRAIQSLQNELQQRGWQRQGDGQNYFANPQASGYQGYHLNVGMPDGTIGEVQIHTPQSLANARLTHGVYDSLGEEGLPKTTKTKLKALQTQIKTDPVGAIESALQQHEFSNPSQVLSPMESNFTNRPEPLTPAGQLAQRLNEANPDVDYRQLNNQEKNAQILSQRAQVRGQQQEAALDQMRVKLGQATNPDIAAQTSAQLQHINDTANQQHYVDNLVRIQKGLQAKLEEGPAQTSPEIDGMLKQKELLQQQVDQAKAYISRYSLEKGGAELSGQQIATPTEIRAHIKDLNASMKNIDEQVKSMRVRLKAQNTQQTTGLKAQIADLDSQIKDAQSKVRVAKAMTPPQIQTQPETTMSKEQIQDILAREPQATSAISTPAPEALNGQGNTESPAQQAFAATKINEQSAQMTAKPQPHPNGAPKENGVFTFSPADGGPAKVGTPSEMGFTRSSKTSNVWEDKEGNQYIANYNPEVENKYKEQAGLPTLRTPDEVMQETNGKVKLSTTQTRGAVKNAVNYLGVPMDLTLSRSPNSTARIAGFGILDAQNYESYLSNKWKTMLENSSKGLSADEIANATKVVEGLEQPMSEGAARYAKTIQAVTQEADQLAKKAGVMTRNEDGSQQAYQSIPNYYPRTYTQAQYDAAAEKATTPQEALEFKRKGQLFTSRFGNMEQHRTKGLEGFEQRRDVQVMEEYADNAAHKIATTSVFGANSEKAATLIQNMIANGDSADANTFKKALEVNGIAQGPTDAVDPTEKLMGNAMQAIRAGIDFTNLGAVTGVHHLTVEPGIISQYGAKAALRSLPEFGKALIGKPSDFARENVDRLHQTEANGAVSNAMGKFYKAIQLDRVLNGFSAQTAAAANFNLDAMEKNLADPAVRTNILQAHLPYDEIVQRGYFTPEERHAYIQAGLKNAGLLFTPDSVAKAATNPIGKAVMALSSPLTARTQRQIPYLFHQIQDNANFSPAVKFTLSAILLGTVSRIASNLIQNHPQGTPQQLLTEGSLAGLGVNYGPLSTTGVANMMQYPTYAPSIAAGMVGGPLAGMAANGLQAYQNIASGNPSNVNTGLREASRYVPIIGPTLGNSVFPAKSWVGNRPLDIAGTLLKGNQPQQQQGILVQHSPLDLVRANPQVAKYQETVNQGYAQAQGSLSAAEKQQLQQVSALNAKGDTQSTTQARNILANDSKIFAAKSIEEKAQAAAEGRKVDPLYMLSPEQGTQYLKYENMSFADKGAYVLNHPEMIATARARDAYYQSPDFAKAQQSLKGSIPGYKGYSPIHNPIYDTFPAGKISLPTAFGNVQYDGNQVIADYKYYQTLAATDVKKAEFAANHPWVEDAKIAEASYNQQVLQQDWNTRPKGQSLADFISAHTITATDGSKITPNIAGVDQNGSIVPAYNPVGDPIYHVNPQLRSAALAYTAMSKTGNTAGKKQILAAYPQLPALWQARAAYYQQNPIAQAGAASGGLGLTFGSGTGGSSGGSSSSSSNYMQTYLEKEALYSMLKENMTPAKLNLRAQLGTPTKPMFANPMDAYAAEQKNLVKILGSMPKLDALPKLQTPTVQPVANKFKISPLVPPFANESVQPAPATGRLTY